MCMSASEKPDRLDGRSDLLAGALSNNASDEEPEWLADAGPTEHHCASIRPESSPSATTHGAPGRALPQALHSWLSTHLDARIVDKTLATLQAEEAFEVADVQRLRMLPRFADCFTAVTCSKLCEALEASGFSAPPSPPPAATACAVSTDVPDWLASASADLLAELELDEAATPPPALDVDEASTPPPAVDTDDAPTLPPASSTSSTSPACEAAATSGAAAAPGAASRRQSASASMAPGIAVNKALPGLRGTSGSALASVRRTKSFGHTRGERAEAAISPAAATGSGGGSSKGLSRSAVGGKGGISWSADGAGGGSTGGGSTGGGSTGGSPGCDTHGCSRGRGGRGTGGSGVGDDGGPAFGTSGDGDEMEWVRRLVAGDFGVGDGAGGERDGSLSGPEVAARAATRRSPDGGKVMQHTPRSSVGAAMVPRALSVQRKGESAPSAASAGESTSGRVGGHGGIGEAAADGPNGTRRLRVPMGRAPGGPRAGGGARTRSSKPTVGLAVGAQAVVAGPSAAAASPLVAIDLRHQIEARRAARELAREFARESAG